MKQASLVGEYSYYRAMPCEMEDVDFCQKMACIKTPRSDIWYSPLKARIVREGFPVIVNYRSIDRWKLVRDQHGKMVLFYREHRTPMPVPVIYVVQYDRKKGYILQNISFLSVILYHIYYRYRHRCTMFSVEQYHLPMLISYQLPSINGAIVDNHRETFSYDPCF